MTIVIDKKPGRKPLRKNGEAAGPIKPPGGPDVVPPTTRVRALRSFSCRLGLIQPGQVVTVERGMARSWIGFGLVEEDKSLDGAPETKN